MDCLATVIFHTLTENPSEFVLNPLAHMTKLATVIFHTLTENLQIFSEPFRSV
jgi:hypothetical protein